MVRRLPLRVLVSAVKQLEEPTGATAKQVLRYLNANYAQIDSKTLARTLRKGVREGFLGQNKSKYLPTCYKCNIRRRRDKTDDTKSPGDKHPHKAVEASSYVTFSSYVPSFISKIFE